MRAYSGQKSVAVAGTAEALGSLDIGGPLMVKARYVNTGKIYVGNNGAGDVDSTNSLELLAGDCIVFDYVRSLSNIIVDSAVSGEGVSWLCLIF